MATTLANPNLDLIRILVDLGGTVFVTVLLLWFGYRIFHRFGGAFVRAQQDIAAAMAREAQSLADLKDTLREFVTRDTADHREILLSLQVIGEELKTLSQEISLLTRRE